MWHIDRAHPLSQFEYGIKLLNDRGPLAFWLNMHSWPEVSEVWPEWNAELLALKSEAASGLRDFKVAEELLTRAETIAPKGPWVHLQRAYLLERLENVEGALEVAYSACKLYPHPVYRAGVQTIAYLLQLLDREEEAIEQLRQVDSSLQSSPLAFQLYGLLVNLQRWSEAEQALERCWSLSPLMDPALKVWFRSQRALVAYRVGKRKEAHKLACELKDPFSQQFAENLDKPAPHPEQVRLEVPFVRQHFKTCAPATMAALGRYWKMPTEHVKLVEAICYDGTPTWQQRDWAEHNGWLVREFRLTWETAIALLNRGIPFAVSTVEATSAHMQAVVGFDLTRGTLLLRDPSQPQYVEVEAKTFLERYRAFGPHGMVLLSQIESSKLDGIPLPDSELYDEYHVLSLALSRYDRETAKSALVRLESQWPDHEIT
jgi:tetratricopeptide (TPR) repeat protein